MTQPLVYPINDACDAGGFRRSRCYQLIAEGKLVAKKMGSRTVITAASLNDYIASLPPADIKTGLAKREKEAATAA